VLLAVQVVVEVSTTLLELGLQVLQEFQVAVVVLPT
jgi:hypothetical protein